MSKKNGEQLGRLGSAAQIWGNCGIFLFFYFFRSVGFMPMSTDRSGGTVINGESLGSVRHLPPGITLSSSEAWLCDGSHTIRVASGSLEKGCWQPPFPPCPTTLVCPWLQDTVVVCLENVLNNVSNKMPPPHAEDTFWLGIIFTCL